MKGSRSEMGGRVGNGFEAERDCILNGKSFLAFGNFVFKRSSEKKLFNFFLIELERES